MDREQLTSKISENLDKEALDIKSFFINEVSEQGYEINDIENDFLPEYKVTIKSEIKSMLLNNYDKFNEQELEIIANTERPLEEIYTQWLKVDYSLKDELIDTIHHVANELKTAEIDEYSSTDISILYQKAFDDFLTENETFHSEPEVRFEQAYSTTIRLETLNLIDKDLMLDDNQIAALNELQNPLDYIYDEWKSNDNSFEVILIDTAKEFIAKEMRATEQTKEVATNNKPRLFVDMDGTLARFHDDPIYLERMFEENFFAELKPFSEAVGGIKEFIKNNPDIEVYILSGAVDGEPPYCRAEKNTWLDRYLPEIDEAHRIFTKVGEHRSLFIPNGISKSDFLYDDYNKSLAEWETDGGTSVKCHNNINHKGLNGALWQGEIISNSLPSNEIATKLETLVRVEQLVAGFEDKRIEEVKNIVFKDKEYKDIFTVPDGGYIKMTRADGEEAFRQCKYLDETHVEIDPNGYKNVYHISQFAEVMNNIGTRYEPIDNPETIMNYTVLDRMKVGDNYVMYAKNKEMEKAFVTVIQNINNPELLKAEYFDIRSEANNRYTYHVYNEQTSPTKFDEKKLATKYEVAYTNDYDQSIPNNNFSEQTESVILDRDYDYQGYLEDNGIYTEVDEHASHILWVIDNEHKRTNEAYFIKSEENVIVDKNNRWEYDAVNNEQTSPTSTTTQLKHLTQSIVYDII